MTLVRLLTQFHIIGFSQSLSDSVRPTEYAYGNTKLEGYGITGKILDIIRDFFNERYMNVIVGGTKSERKKERKKIFFQ